MQKTLGQIEGALVAAHGCSQPADQVDGRVEDGMSLPDSYTLCTVPGQLLESRNETLVRTLRAILGVRGLSTLRQHLLIHQSWHASELS